MNNIILTAPQFKQRGGRLLDTRFVPTMGMPYLLAHGIDKPVDDATVDFESEAYRCRL